MLSKIFRKGAPAALLLCFGLATSSAQAAQDAIVSRRASEVHEAPNGDSGVLIVLEPGTRIRISSASKQGWFKVLLSDERIGWMDGADLTLQDSRPDFKAAGIAVVEANSRTRGISRWEVSVGLGARSFSGTPRTLPFEVTVRLDYGFSPVFKLGAQYRLFSTRTATSDGVRGSFATLAAEFLVINSLPWRVSLSLGGGLGKLGAVSSPVGEGLVRILWSLDPGVSIGIESGYVRAIQAAGSSLSSPAGAARLSFEL